MKQSFILIGMNDNPEPWFHPDALNYIQAGTVFSGGLRHYGIVKHLLPPDSEWINITVPLENVFARYRGFRRVIVFVSGDPLFFGFGNTIKNRLPDAEIITYPTFNSLQMLAHRLVMRYDDMHTVSLTGRSWHEFDRALIEGREKTGILTDREHTPVTIAQRMLEYGYDNYIAYIGEHLGNPQKERIRTMKLEEVTQSSFQHPNNLIVVRKHARRSGFMGIPDEEFFHLEGRPKMITKAPIRILTLSALSLKDKQSFWDIGFCTGSISVEAKLLFPFLHITAFEIRKEGRELMKQNCRKFGTPGITTVIDDFTTANISEYPQPDAVFIGGHGGKLKEIICRIGRVLKPGGVVVLNSVNAESKKTFTEGIKENNMELTSVTHIALDEYNPIDIMKATKR